MPDKEVVSGAVPPQNDPVMVTATGIPIPQRSWASVKAGVVTEVRKVAHFLAHPFSDSEAKGARVIDVTGVPCEPGYFVDAKGQVTPPEGRSAPIADGLPAYHQGPVALSTAGTIFAGDLQAQGKDNEDKNKTEAGQAPEPVLVQTQGLHTVIPQNREQALAPDLAITAAPGPQADAPTSTATKPDAGKPSKNS